MRRSAFCPRVLQGPGLEEAVEQALNSPAVERALNQAIESEMTERVWARLLASDEVQKLVERIAEAPEVRNAIAAQGVGFLGDLGRELARATRRLDDVVEGFARRLLRRPRRQGQVARAGLVSRSAAMLLDGAIVNGGFLVLSAVIALVASVFIDGDPAAAPTIAIGSGLWLIGGAGYLVVFRALRGKRRACASFGSTSRPTVNDGSGRAARSGDYSAPCCRPPRSASVSSRC